ncbi:MAG: BatA and WFA domain-containing protein [Planctomycetaceae bacterium]|nr:BatA and WFA domain-containing protein [Planctomycetaceae bacterium]
MTGLAVISLVAPAMLGAAALLALPIAAHLISRRTRRVLVFPTVRLLEHSTARTSWLYRIRRWIVLVLRCLTVLMVVLAFCQPVWTDDTAAASPDSGAAVVLLLDTSASMAQHTGGVGLTQAMQALAERALDSLTNGLDRVGVVYASAQPQSAFPQLSNNLDAIRQELQRIKPTSHRADFPRAVTLAAKLLGEHQGQRRLVVISDLQRSNWSDVSFRGATALPAGTIVTILPVGAEGNANVCLSQPRCLPAQPIANQPLDLIVHAANDSPQPRTVAVEVTLDGHKIGAVSAALGAWGGSEVTLRTKAAAVGAHRVVFSTAPDTLAADNAACLTVNVVRRVPVVVVGDDNPDQPGSSTYFIIRALAPRGDEGDDLEVRHLTSADLTYARIAETQAVFVAQVGALPPAALNALYIYANQGGGVAMFCGEGPAVENLTALAGAAIGVEVLPWTPKPHPWQGSAGSFLQITRGQWDSPLLSDFDAQSQAALKQVRFSRFIAAGLHRPGAQTLLQYSDGTPALSTATVGSGTLAVCNFNPSLTCSDLGKYGGFVALMQSLFTHLRPRHSRASQTLAGEALTCPIAAGNAGAGNRIAVIGPDGRPCAAEALEQADRLLVRLDRADLPGFYDIRRNDAPAAVAAVNLDAREGDLRRSDPRSLAEHLAGAGVAVTVRSADDEGPAFRVRGRPLWYWFVLAGMFSVALELALLCLWKQ